MKSSTHGILTAGVVSRLVLDPVPWGGGLFIWNISQEAPIWCRLDGVDPAVMADNSMIVVDYRRYHGEFVDVRLVSEAAVTYSIEVNR